MGIHNWLEKRKRNKMIAKEDEQVYGTPHGVQGEINKIQSEIIEGLACPEFAAEMGRVALGAQQQPIPSPLEALLGSQGVTPTAQAYQAMIARSQAPMTQRGFSTMTNEEFLAFAGGCASSCQPHRGRTICNTVSPRERKHVDSEEVPQKCLPSGGLQTK